MRRRKRAVAIVCAGLTGALLVFLWFSSEILRALVDTVTGNTREVQQ